MSARRLPKRDPFVVGYVPAWLPSYEAQRHRVVERSYEVLRRQVDEAGGRLVTIDAPVEDGAGARDAAAAMIEADADLVVVQCASFAMGDVARPFLEARLRTFLWAPAEPRRHGPIPLNGFVAMHLHAGVARTSPATRSTPYKWAFGDEGDPTFLPRLQVTLAAVRALHAARGATIVRVGEVAPTFDNVACDPEALRRWTGADVVHRGLEPILERTAQLRDAGPDSADGRAVADAVRVAYDVVGGRVDLDAEAVRASVAAYVALRECAWRENADALAVRDWPEYQSRLGIHPGMACSLLDHVDAVPVAAEGDVGGALSMIVGRAVSRDEAYLLDVNDVDPQNDRILTWHCGGSPLGLALPGTARWTPHTTLARGDATPVGAVADLSFRPGPVTLCRVGRDGATWFAVDGEVAAGGSGGAPTGFDGTRGWVGRFHDVEPRSALDVVDTLVHDGIEHHLVLTPGHHAASLREAAVWAHARPTALRRYDVAMAPPPYEPTLEEDRA